MKKSRFTDSRSLEHWSVWRLAFRPRIYTGSLGCPRRSFASGVPSTASSMMARLKEREFDNAHLKKMYPEKRLKAKILSEAFKRVGRTPLQVWAGQTASEVARHIGTICTPDLYVEGDLLTAQGQEERLERADCGLAAIGLQTAIATGGLGVAICNWVKLMA